jgi:hypothetical protein
MMAARLGSLVLLLLSLLISGEAGSFLFLHYIAGVDWIPAYLIQGPPLGGGWLSEREPWGAWHLPNKTGRKEGRCYSAALRSNFFGARDRERTVSGDTNRTIVLGWGIEEGERFSNLLERSWNSLLCCRQGLPPVLVCAFGGRSCPCAHRRAY